jgi:hypothetical protein
MVYTSEASSLDCSLSICIVNAYRLRTCYHLQCDFHSSLTRSNGGNMLLSVHCGYRVTRALSIRDGPPLRGCNLEVVGCPAVSDIDSSLPTQTRLGLGFDSRILRYHVDDCHHTQYWLDKVPDRCCLGRSMLEEASSPRAVYEQRVQVFFFFFSTKICNVVIKALM